MGLFIVDDYDENVEQSIVIGGEALIHLSEESNVVTTDRASHPLGTTLVRNKEEEYFQ